MKNLLKKIIVCILTIISRLVLWKYKPNIIAVTGTVGKTSTKDAIGTVFSHFFETRSSNKSFNSEIGVPLTILGLDNKWNSVMGWFSNIVKGVLLFILPNKYPDWLVVEVGMDRPGEIRRISKWLSPDIVVATHFADIPVHVEFFDSPEDLISEEQSIAFSLKKDGVLVVNAGDKYGLELKEKINKKTISFGIDEKAGVVASHIETLYENGRPSGIRFRADHECASGPVVLDGVLGIQHVFPILAALSCGISIGLNVIEMSEALRGHTPPPGRMRILKGINNSTIIDDTYNSSPIAVERALEVMDDINTSGRKIVILGDMRELGKYSQKEHKRIGEIADRISDMTLYVGEAALDFGNNHVGDVLDAIEYMRGKIRENDVVLVKGSQGVRLEKLVATIIEGEAKDFLVRQDREWENI